MSDRFVNPMGPLFPIPEEEAAFEASLINFIETDEERAEREEQEFWSLLYDLEDDPGKVALFNDLVETLDPTFPGHPDHEQALALWEEAEATQAAYEAEERECLAFFSSHGGKSKHPEPTQSIPPNAAEPTVLPSRKAEGSVSLCASVTLPSRPCENSPIPPLPMDSIKRILGVKDNSADRATTEKPSPYAVAQKLIRNEQVVCVGNALYVFDGQIYRLLNRDAVGRFIMGACREAVAEVGEPAFIDKIYRILFAEPGICYKPPIPSSANIVFQDGILDIHTWELKPHTPTLFSTTKINTSYRRGTLMNCPRFDNFLATITGGDPVLTQRIWEMLGYLMTEDMNGKCFFVLQGVPDSGKSVLGNFIRDCFDEETVSAMDINEFSKDFALADLIGKRLCTDLDLPAGTLSSRAVSYTKKLTGRDPLSANIKFMPRVTFINTAKLLFATNHPIVTTEYDPAFLRRMIVIPFRYAVDRDKQDENFQHYLNLERADIVVKALHSYVFLQANHYRFSGEFPPNQICAETPSNAIHQDALVAEFLIRECRPVPGIWTPTRILFEAFSEKCPSVCTVNAFSNITENFCVQNYYGEITKERHRVPGESNPISGYTGLALKNLKGGVKLHE